MLKRENKFRRDKMDVSAAKLFSLTLMNKFEQREVVRNTRHHPIIINSVDQPIPNDLKELCSKGPSFVPTPVNYNWLQLQKDFDSFKNRLRAPYIFQ